MKENYPVSQFAPCKGKVESLGNKKKVNRKLHIFIINPGPGLIFNYFFLTGGSSNSISNSIFAKDYVRCCVNFDSLPNYYPLC